MNVLDIVKDYLEANGFDGLAGSECGCAIDDLAPCNQDMGAVQHCEPGYKTPCVSAEVDDIDTPIECEGNCEWHITTERPKDRKEPCGDCGNPNPSDAHDCENGCID